VRAALLNPTSNICWLREKVLPIVLQMIVIKLVIYFSYNRQVHQGRKTQILWPYPRISFISTIRRFAVYFYTYGFYR
jgi:hypothetical protein